jgi:hypothetical protein
VSLRLCVSNVEHTTVRSATRSNVNRWIEAKRSEVSVINVAGKQRRLKVLNTREEAQAAATRMEAELSELGLDGWCSRYQVPISFFRV